MPITPFHFGPGLLMKAAFGRHFSLSVFIASHIAIDLESAINMARGAWPVHARLHTLPGSLVAATIVVMLGQRWLPAIHRAWNRRAGPGWTIEARIPMHAAVTGGLAGALSHVLLDGIMHSDARPFAPWLSDNPLYAWVSMAALHQACVACALVGAIVLGLARVGRVSRSASSEDR